MSSLAHPQRTALARIFALQTAPELVEPAVTDAHAPTDASRAGGLSDALGFQRTCLRASMHALRQREPLCLALLSVAGPRSAGGGDREFSAAAEVALSGVFRSSDVLARWGEAEFAVLFPRTPVRGGVRALEKAARALQLSLIEAGASEALQPIFSGGVANLVPGAPFMDAITEAARLLELAQQAGPGTIRWADGELRAFEPRVLLLQHGPASERERLRDLLAFGGAAVANEAETALALTATEALPPSLIVIDLAEDGAAMLTALERFRASPRLNAVPIVVIGERSADLSAAFARGADDFLCRPFSPEELLARVRRLLRRAIHGRAAPVS